MKCLQIKFYYFSRWYEIWVSAIPPKGNDDVQKFLIVFEGRQGNYRGAHMTEQYSRWDACAFGWDNMPAGATDFQVFDEDEHIRLTGATFDGPHETYEEVMARKVAEGLQRRISFA